jgi:leucyl aminopeptidase
MPPRFAPASADALPLHVLNPGETLPGHADWLAAGGFKAGLGEVRLLPGPAGVAGAVVGRGTEDERARVRFGLARAATALPGGDWRLTGVLPAPEARDAALGWLLAGYRFDRYRAANGRDAARLVAPEGVGARRLEVLAEAEFLTRDLINTPANDLPPEGLQAAFMAVAARFGAVTSLRVGEALLRDGFPMVHAVGRAAAAEGPRAPRIMEMRWGEIGPAVTLVGKGVCFDSGGLDLKPSAGMLLMKKDMGGAATVIGLAQAIMALEVPVRLRVIVPAVENSVGPEAMRPRDILRSRKGLTVEVNNTDAEGRLILADALAWADEERPDLIVSFATLTGSARVALGPDLPPVFTDDDTLAARLVSEPTDPLWRMPFWAPYEPQIEPGIADLDNAPAGGMAGAITAALFLRRFVSGRYAHLDIYGHQMTDAPGRPKGGVGQGARAVLAAIEAMA